MLPITVIIPTWNRKKLLIRAIDSVLRQSVSCKEILIIDDGSNDGTAQMVKEWAKKEPRLQLISQKNRGAAAARNTGIRAAKCKYIAFLDSDDHWKKKKLEKQFAALSTSSFFISHTKEIWFRRGKHLNQKKIHIPRHGNIFDHCLKLCAVGMSTVMAKQEFFNQVGLFNENLHCCEDYDLWLRGSAQLPFLLIDTPLTVKEGGREDQLSVRYRVGMDKLRIRSISELIESNTLEKEDRELALKELNRKVNIFAQGCTKHNNKEEGQHYLALLEKYL